MPRTFCCPNTCYGNKITPFIPISEIFIICSMKYWTIVYMMFIVIWAKSSINLSIIFFGTSSSFKYWNTRIIIYISKIFFFNFLVKINTIYICIPFCFTSVLFSSDIERESFFSSSNSNVISVLIPTFFLSLFESFSSLLDSGKSKTNSSFFS